MNGEYVISPTPNAPKGAVSHMKKWGNNVYKNIPRCRTISNNSKLLVRLYHRNLIQISAITLVAWNTSMSVRSRDLCACNCEKSKVYDWGGEGGII